MVALQAASHLRQKGEAIFILPNRFFVSTETNSVRDALPQFGLFLHAIIALPAASFSTSPAIELNLVFITRAPTAKVFVGRLSPDQDATTLIENFKKHKSGALPELGRIIGLNEYRG